MRRFAILISLFLPLGLAAQTVEDEAFNLECTSIMVGRAASGTGSVITSHTCDGVSHTWVELVPAANHKKGETTDIRKNFRKTRFIKDTAGVKIVGSIPQVAHTYAYVNTGYPCLNEKQLAIGETTFSGPDTLINRKSMFVIEELCRLALERCDNARDAIRLMGALAEQYGYGDGGECLTVADKNEVWQFEITGNGKHSTGAVWAAQRIPDDHVAISANITRIGRIDRSDTDNFMASDNVEEVAKSHGLWDGKSEFIFWKAIKCDYAKGKNFREREFIVFSQLAPSLGLSYDMDELPFSVKPDSTVSARRVIEILRGTYDGTPFDQCTNWHNPWVNKEIMNMINGFAPGAIDFHRTLAVAWCSYSTVIELRRDLPDAIGGVCWYAVDNPGQSPHIPIFSGMTRLPEDFEYCGQRKFDPDYVLWRFRKANKLATLNWKKTKKSFCETLDNTENLTFERLSEAEKEFLDTKSKSLRTRILNNCTCDIYKRAAATWKDLEEKYWFEFGRGF